MSHQVLSIAMPAKVKKDIRLLAAGPGEHRRVLGLPRGSLGHLEMLPSLRVAPRSSDCHPASAAASDKTRAISARLVGMTQLVSNRSTLRSALASAPGVPARPCDGQVGAGSPAAWHLCGFRPAAGVMGQSTDYLARHHAGLDVMAPSWSTEPAVTTK